MVASVRYELENRTRFSSHSVPRNNAILYSFLHFFHRFLYLGHPPTYFLLFDHLPTYSPRSSTSSSATDLILLRCNRFTACVKPRELLARVSHDRRNWMGFPAVPGCGGSTYSNSSWLTQSPTPFGPNTVYGTG